MKFTNLYKLPQGIYDAILNDSYDIGEADYSVSQLATPPQMRRLIQLHTNEITVDVSDEIWKLFGSSVHYILDAAQGKTNQTLDLELRVNKALLEIEDGILKADTVTERDEILGRLHQIKLCLVTPNEPVVLKTRVTEERLYARIGGFKLSGKPDWREIVKQSLEDYKVTSVWKLLRNDFADWAFQLNSYNFLCDYNSIPVQTLQINAILKDWKAFEFNQKRDTGYPPHPFAVVPIDKWSLLETTRMIIDKLSDHEAIRLVSDAEELYKIRPCSNEEKWHSEDKYAVMKEGGKKASKVFDTEVEAWEYIQGRTDAVYAVEPRLGEDKRCEEYCLAKPFCAQYKKEHGTEMVMPASANLNLLTDLLPSNDDVKKEKDEVKNILQSIIDESNAVADINILPKVSDNEVDNLLQDFHVKKNKIIEDGELNLDKYLEG